MLSEIIIPALGATHSDITLDAWLVQPGEYVHAGQPLVTITTDKATVEIESFRDGYLRAHLAHPGDTIPLGTAIALITDTPDEPIADSRWQIADSGKQSSGSISPQDSAPSTLRQPIENRKSKIENPTSPSAVLQAHQSLIPNPQSLVPIYRRMLLIRRFEDYLYQLFLQGLVPGTLHQYQGQEAVAVGVSFALEPGDVIFSTHRPVGHFLAQGSSPRGIAAEIWGKATGCAGGKGGQMHLCDMSVGAPPSNAIVGANIPIATGAALAFQLRGESHVAVSYFGDGATNIGAFHEGINLAAVKNAPVLFVCENNQYAASTHISQTARVTDLAARAASYGIPGIVVDGMDVLAVREAARIAVDRARRGEGPTLLECKTYRYMGHSRGDPGGYRNRSELAEWRDNDPIQKLRALLTETYNADPATLDALDQEVQQEVEAAVAYARSSPDPSPESLFEHVFAA